MKIHGQNFHRNRDFFQAAAGRVCLLLLIMAQGCNDERTPAKDGVKKNEPRVSSELNWPVITSQNRPWTRWWWMGSAVDEANLTAVLTEYSRAGLGGVEICPIYGVKGHEKQFIDFLSPEWTKMLAHTTQQADRLGMGVDLTTGTGWPFGGPWITAQTASSGVILKRYELAEGGKLASKLPDGQLQVLAAVSEQGKRIDLTEKVKDGNLDWRAPAGKWKLYAVAQKQGVQKVKRAAPGGAGFTVDPYSVKSLDSYLSAFDKAFPGFQGKMPRSQFHDSFEYYGATWTNDFFAEFRTRRGYDLRTQIAALFGDGPQDVAARVQSDYRRTISDLHLAYIRHWTQWCHVHKSLSRNQAHGAPGNIIDIYAAADIPETEIFRKVDTRQIPMLKMSSSAAHLKGTALASSESFTWLKEHFQCTLADVKPAADFLFLSGVNHVFFHGIPYSPPSSEWPGWQFYAAVNFGPTGGLWRDLPALNAYITRCQSILQSGRADNNILLYFPVEDIWNKNGELSMPLKIHTEDQDKWLWPTPFYNTAIALWKSGYAADYISDSFIGRTSCKSGKIELNGNTFDVILVPACRKMPAETMEKLLSLAKTGVTVIFDGAMPVDVPGFYQYQARQEKMKTLLGGISFDKRISDAVSCAATGKGRLLRGNAEPALSAAGVMRETMTDLGLQFVRRTHPEGFHYFVVNFSDKAFDGWITLGVGAQSVVLMNPYFENKTGLAATRKTTEGKTEVYLQLEAGQSCILRTFTSKTVDGPAWVYWKETPLTPSAWSWKIEFVDGGPVLPKPYETSKLSSWTTWPDTEVRRFAGTARYTTQFALAGDKADGWLLDLGQVCDSARVTVNGQYAGTLWSKPYRINIGQYLKLGNNILQVEVTNVAANRIRDMDQRKVQWKYFYDTNVVNVDYKPFDASDWPLRDSGLIGPVNLIGLEKISF
jgi:hypothetical protein